MQFSNKCPFCSNSRYINNRIANSPEEEAILFENDNIYIRVDISPLCRGHILIITKQHYLNFFELPYEIKKDVIKIMNKVKEVYKSIYHTDVLFFEHGSTNVEKAGASIDHAHLHCIPYKFDINNSIQNILGNAESCNIITNDRTNYNGQPYIYVENEKDGCKLYKVTQLPSQFLRKLIFDKQGDKQYKWQEKCVQQSNKKKLNETIMDLKGKIYL